LEARVALFTAGILALTAFLEVVILGAQILSRDKVEIPKNNTDKEITDV
jgi:hypothetical protein